MGIYIPGLKGNATVPGTFPIQPPQVGVDNITQFVIGPSTGTISLSGKGITSLQSLTAGTGGLYDCVITMTQTGNGVVVDLSINAITNTNAILAAMVQAFNSGGVVGSIDLSGGTNAAPTGQGIIDKATLIAATWTVTTN